MRNFDSQPVERNIKEISLKKDGWKIKGKRYPRLEINLFTTYPCIIKQKGATTG